MYRVVLLAAVVAASLASATIARAEERVGDFVVYQQSSDVIALDGQIGDATMGDFQLALAERPHAKVLLLNSGGGDVDDALRLAAAVRQRGMSTAIPRSFGCYSACSYLFFAGREHVARGELGVHQVRGAGPSAAPAYDGDVRQALKRYGASDGVIAAMVSTPADSLHVFSADEIAALAINRSAGSKSLAAAYASR